MKLTKETNLYRDHAVKNGVDDAAKVATNYLDYDQQTGLTLGYVGTSERAVITSDGMEIYDGLNDQIAQFKAVTRIGLATEGNLQLDYHSLQLQDLDGLTYVHLSDLRGRDKFVTITKSYIGDGTTTTFRLDYITAGTSYNVLSVTINGTETSAYTIQWYADGSRAIKFSTAPVSGAEIIIVYKTDYIIRAYSFGERAPDSMFGRDSLTVGYHCTASGVNSVSIGQECSATSRNSYAEGNGCVSSNWESHAEGNGCIANGAQSHAEGIFCTASEQGAHAEGKNCTSNDDGCHAEGVGCDAGDPTPYSTPGNGAHAEGYYCSAIGNGAHAEGYYCSATGEGAHAEGRHTIASAAYQHVSGRYNVEVNSYTTIFIVGGGSSSTRKNILTLSDTGNMTIAGTLTQSSDKRLKHHRAYLSDQQNEVNDFINQLKPAWFEKDEQKHLGFYAQDVQQTDRWQCMVKNDTNGYLTLGYTEILAPLVAYCQNLEQKVETLEQRIARLEQLLNQQ